MLGAATRDVLLTCRAQCGHLEHRCGTHRESLGGHFFGHDGHDGHFGARRRPLFLSRSRHGVLFVSIEEWLDPQKGQLYHHLLVAT